MTTVLQTYTHTHLYKYPRPSRHFKAYSSFLCHLIQSNNSRVDFIHFELRDHLQYNLGVLILSVRKLR